jgi:hypothetical protein
MSLEMFGQNRIAKALALSISSLVVIGCSSSPSKPFVAPLNAYDFREVCLGASESRAAAYDKTANIRPAVLIRGEGDSARPVSLPPDWTVKTEAKKDTFAAIQVVGCSKRIGQTYLRDCSYSSDTKGKTNILKQYQATYSFTVLEAKTAKKLGETTIEAKDEECPVIATFSKDGEGEDSFMENDTAEKTFLKPFVQPNT